MHFVSFTTSCVYYFSPRGRNPTAALNRNGDHLIRSNQVFPLDFKGRKLRQYYNVTLIGPNRSCLCSEKMAFYNHQFLSPSRSVTTTVTDMFFNEVQTFLPGDQRKKWINRDDVLGQYLVTIVSNSWIELGIWMNHCFQLMRTCSPPDKWKCGFSASTTTDKWFKFYRQAVKNEVSIIFAPHTQYPVTGI